MTIYVVVRKQLEGAPVAFCGCIAAYGSMSLAEIRCAEEDGKLSSWERVKFAHYVEVITLTE